MPEPDQPSPQPAAHPASPGASPAPQAAAGAQAHMVLMFTDIVGSVAMKRELGDVAYLALLNRHRAIIESAVASETGGRVVEFTGDGFLIRFDTPAEAVRSALRFQCGLAAEPWDGHPIRIRTGIHSGVAIVISGPGGRPNVSGLAVDVAARVMGLAAPGQVLMTRHAFDDARQFVRAHPLAASADSAQLPAVGSAPAASDRRLEWRAHGPYLFKGTDEPLEIYEVGTAGLAPLKPPPDGDKARRAVPAGEEPMYDWRPGLGLEVPRRMGWRIERKLGEGGFGEVWLARHHKTGERRVFKFCFDAGRLRSFRRELTLFRLLREALGDRRDIARIHEVSLEQPPYYLEAEYSPGGDLHDWAERDGGIARIPFERRMDILRRVADAVAAAHSVGVLHKDLKPANILMDATDAGEVRPKLADFGIGMLADRAALVKAGVTAAGFTLPGLTMNDSSRTGTRLYAPPESLVAVRIEGSTEGPPAFTSKGDVYAIGVMLFQMVVGDLDRPLAAGWERSVDAAIADPLLRGILRADIAEMVEGDPNLRLASASEAARRLGSLAQRRDQLAQQEAIRRAAAEAEARAVQAEARRRKMRTVAAVTLAFLVVVAAGGALFIAQLGMERDAAVKAKNEAETERGRAETAAMAEAIQRARAADAARRAEFEAERARQEAAIGRGHSGAVIGVAVSPDGHWAVSGGWDKTVRLWRLGGDHGISSAATGSGHTDHIVSLAMSKDGKWAVSSGYDASIRLWRLDGSGGMTAAGWADAGAKVYGVALTADGKWLVSGGADRMVRVWRLDGEGGIHRAGEGAGHADLVRCVGVTPDGAWAVSGSYDSSIRVWRLDGAGGITPASSKVAHERWMLSLDVSHDGRRVVTASVDKSVRLWALDGNGGITESASGTGHTHMVKAAAFSPDGQFVASAGLDKTVRLWRVGADSSLAPAGTGKHHLHTVSGLAWHPDGQWLVSGAWDETVRLWRVEDGNLRPAETRHGHTGNVNGVAFSPDSKWAVSGSSDRTVRLWRVTDAGRLEPAASGEGHTELIHAVRVSPDGRWMLSGSADHTLRLWALDGNGRMAPAGVGHGHTEPVEGVAFSPDGAWALSASQDKSVKLWRLDGTGGIEAAGTGLGHTNWVNSVAFSPDGRLGVSCGSDSTARLWRLDGAGGIASAGVGEGHVGEVMSVAFLPSGDAVVTAGLDRTLRVWGVGPGGISPGATIAAHDGEITTVAASETGGVILSGGRDRTIRLWHRDGERNLVLAAHGPVQVANFVNAVAVSRDGKLVLAANWDRTVGLWRVADDGGLAYSDAK